MNEQDQLVFEHDEKGGSTSHLPLIGEDLKSDANVKTELIGEETPKMTHCPECDSEINEASVRAVKAGKKMHMHGKAFRAVITVCRKCGHSFGFSGLLPVASAYTESLNTENKKRKRRLTQKEARRRNRR